MVLPVGVLGDTFQRVEDAGVVLVVELVDGRSVVLRQTVVDPLLRLHDAGLARGLEQLDEAIADPSEVQRRLGLPLLGTVPKVDEDETPRDALLDRKSEMVDATRYSLFLC